MDGRSQLDLVITSLVLIRKASSAIDAALSLPASDRARLEAQLEAVRTDLGQLLGHVGSSIPGAGGVAKRPEVKAAAGVVEFLARQGAAQLGAVAGVADALRVGDDSRGLAQRIDAHLRTSGVATREEIAEAVGVEADSPRLQEALERVLGGGRAEWYGPGVYGVPRGQLEELSELEPDAAGEDEQVGEQGAPPQLAGAVSALEGSLGALASALSDPGQAERSASERIRDLRQLADEGVVSAEEFERRKAELLEEI